MIDESLFGESVAGAMDERTPGEGAHFSVAGAMRKLDTIFGVRSVRLFEHGGIQIRMYAPRGRDPQKAQNRDELYVVARGSGVFYNGISRRSFQSGDLIFAPAGSWRRFEDFSEDFAAWVIFYGSDDAYMSMERKTRNDHSSSY